MSPTSRRCAENVALVLGNYSPCGKPLPCRRHEEHPLVAEVEQSAAEEYERQREKLQIHDNGIDSIYVSITRELSRAEQRHVLGLLSEAWKAGWCAGVSRLTQRDLPPEGDPYEAMLKTLEEPPRGA